MPLEGRIDTAPFIHSLPSASFPFSVVSHSVQIGAALEISFLSKVSLRTELKKGCQSAGVILSHRRVGIDS